MLNSSLPGPLGSWDSYTHHRCLKKNYTRRDLFVFDPLRRASQNHRKRNGGRPHPSPPPTHLSPGNTYKQIVLAGFLRRCLLLARVQIDCRRLETGDEDTELARAGGERETLPSFHSRGETRSRRCEAPASTRVRGTVQSAVHCISFSPTSVVECDFQGFITIGFSRSVIK